MASSMSRSAGEGKDGPYVGSSKYFSLAGGHTGCFHAGCAVESLNARKSGLYFRSTVVQFLKVSDTVTYSELLLTKT